MQRRIVITGIGMLTPLGNTTKNTWESLVNGQSGIDYIESFDTSECESEILGDLNEDQLINVQDVIILVNYILESYYDEQGDMNQNGVLNIQDVIILIGIILES